MGYPGGFSTDLPIEPICILLMGVTLVYVFQEIKQIDFRFLYSPIIFIIGLLLIWSFICIIPSKVLIISLKYNLSKIWYLATYLVLSILLLKSIQDLKKLFWFIFLPMFFTMVYAFIRHAMNGFSFELMNEPSLPFYRNHVIYAATITIFYPFIFLARTWYKDHFLISGFLKFNQWFFPIVIYFTYTRACMLALVVGLIFYFLMKKRLVKKLLGVTLALITFGASFLAYENNYLKYAPEFTKTIYHDSYDNHIEATFEGHDASSMERINMWIGAIRMFPDYPVFGVGPGNFYPYYKSYTVVHYHTWVSDVGRTRNRWLFALYTIDHCYLFYHRKVLSSQQQSANKKYYHVLGRRNGHAVCKLDLK
jgi:O-antigen ligase